MIQKIITIGFFLACSIAIQAQSTTIQGIIFDYTTSQPIPNALIEIKNQNIAVKSDENGNYSIEATIENTVQVTCSRLGYRSISSNPSYQEEETIYLDFEMHPIFERLNTHYSQTPQRSSNIMLNVPEAITLISNQDIQINTPRTTAETLTGKTGLSLLKTHHGGGTPIIRGLTTNHNSVLVDGIRLNNSLSGAFPFNFLNSVDVLSLDKIEILHSGSSSLYGSDAMGGTINLITKAPDLPLDENRTKGHGHVLAKYRSNNMERVLNAEGQFNIKKNALLIGGSFKNFGDLISGQGTLTPNSAYSESNTYLKYIIPIKRGKITLGSFNTLQQNQEISTPSLINQYKKFKYDQQSYNLLYAKFQYISRSNWIRIIKGHLAYQNNYLQLTSQKVNQELFQDKTGIHTISGNIEGTSNLPKRIKMLLGININQEILYSSKSLIDTINNEEIAVQSFYPTRALNTQIGIYNKYFFPLPNEKGKINFGWRYQINRLNQSETTFGEMNTTPSSLGANLGGFYELARKHHLTANIHTNYRLPNFHDFGGVGQSISDFETGIIVPNLDLTAERSLTFELGYKLQNQRISGNISLYRTQLYDFIHLKASTYSGSSIFRNQAVYKMENAINGYVQGIETEWDLLINKHFLGFINLAYAKGKNTSDNQPLGIIPTLNGQIALHYKPRKNIRIIAEYLFAGEQQYVPEFGIVGINPLNLFIDRNDWQVVNLKAQLQFKKVDFVIGINNIFDETYLIHNAQIAEYGRNAVFILKWKF